MADKVSKVVLAWQVQGETQAVASVGRVQAATNNAAKASDTLKETLTDLRVEAASVDLGKKYGEMAQDITKADEAAKSLADELARIGASKSDIAAAAREFEAFRTAQDATGAGGGGSSALTQFGAKLRSLPSTRIPGTELGTDAIGNLARVIGTLPPAVLPVIALLGGVAVGFVLLGKSLEDARAKVQAAIEAQNKYFQQLQDLTTKQAQLEIDRLKIRNELIRAQVESELRVVEIGKEGVVSAFSGIFDAVGVLLGGAYEDLAKRLATAGVSKDVLDNIQKLGKEFDANATSIGLLTDALKDGALAANDAAEAIKKATADGIQRTIDLAGKQADTQIEIQKLVAEGSAKDLEAKKKSVEAEKEKATIELGILGAQLAAAKDGSAEQIAFQAKILELTRAFNDADDQLQALNGSVVTLGVTLNDAKAKIEKNNTEIGNLIIGYNEDRAKADDAAYKELADIQQKYNDSLVKAAQDAADAAEKALQKLNDQAEKLATNLQRDNESAQRKAQDDALKAAVKFQEQEAKAARDHANTLLKIQQDAANREQDLIASRDFAGLFRSRRDTATQIQQLNQQYTQEQAERLLAFQQAQADRANDYANQARERQIKYQQALEDARKQYNKELTAANVAYIAAQSAAVRARDTQLQIAQSKYDAEINLLNAHIQRSLQLYAQGLSAEEQLRQAQTAALLQQAGLANGNFAAPAVNFGAAGVSSSTSNSSTSLNNTFNIRGSNPSNIANEVLRVISGLIS
jgi:hypothetical protein